MIYTLDEYLIFIPEGKTLNLRRRRLPPVGKFRMVRMGSKGNKHFVSALSARWRPSEDVNDGFADEGEAIAWLVGDGQP